MTVRQKSATNQPPEPKWLILAILSAVALGTLVVTRSPQAVSVVIPPILLAWDYAQRRL